MVIKTAEYFSLILTDPAVAKARGTANLSMTVTAISAAVGCLRPLKVRYEQTAEMTTEPTSFVFNIFSIRAACAGTKSFKSASHSCGGGRSDDRRR